MVILHHHVALTECTTRLTLQIEQMHEFILTRSEYQRFIGYGNKLDTHDGVLMCSPL